PARDIFAPEMPRVEIPGSAAAVRGVLAGALGGACAAVGDHLLAAERARQFLPDGTLRLLVFLMGLYAASGAVLGVGAAVLLRVLARTDLGRLWRATFCAEPAAPSENGPRIAAYVPGVAAA